jgi:hypothetical protein
MEIDNPEPVEEKPKKKKKKFLAKLKIPEDHSNPTDSGAGMGEETKAADSIISTGSYQHVIVDKEQIEIQDEMDKFAPQVHGNTITLKKKFAEPAGTLESNADVSMTSNSLCNRIAESSLGSGTMSFEDIQKTVMHIDKYSNKVDDSDNSTMEDELVAQINENDAVLKGNKDLDVSINLSDLKKVGALGQGASGYVEK